MSGTSFADRVLAWFDHHGRKDLPWQADKSPYRVWLSETMLQQTQVATVIPYFNAFVARFPTVAALAGSPLDEVLGYWSGLGYYARARNLHKAAQQIHEQGCFPDTVEGLLKLPGIGLSTAGAIMSIAFEHSQPILDGNVRRVLARVFAIEGWPGDARINNRMWALSRQVTPECRSADYTQAIMDLGATVCKRARPLCTECPLCDECIAYREQRTGELPSAKPSKKIPVKSQAFLLLVNGRQEIYLEKRPPLGIWGGLWCPPAFEDEAGASAWCQGRSIAIIERYALSKRRHTFSHYHLDFTPWVVLTDTHTQSINDVGGGQWLRLDALEGLALAAPIKRLLQQFQSNNKQG